MNLDILATILTTALAVLLPAMLLASSSLPSPHAPPSGLRHRRLVRVCRRLGLCGYLYCKRHRHARHWYGRCRAGHCGPHRSSQVIHHSDTGVWSAAFGVCAAEHRSVDRCAVPCPAFHESPSGVLRSQRRLGGCSRGCFGASARLGCSPSSPRLAQCCFGLEHSRHHGSSGGGRARRRFRGRVTLALHS